MSENETIIVVDIPVRDISGVIIHLEMLTNQDVEDLESKSFAKLNAVYDRLVTIPGHDHRKLHYSTMQVITKALLEAIKADVNPVVDGKN